VTLMRIVLFSHSLRSCWKHGNAHFLRGVVTELARLGHDVVTLEPARSWSASNLAADHGDAGLAASLAAHAGLDIRLYDETLDIAAALDGADLVLVHEWTDRSIVEAIGRVRRSARFTLLFHDTHHRAVSDPESILGLPLDDYDGILAFGRSLADVWSRAGWGRRAFVWHEAADARLFRPMEPSQPRQGLVFVGNWGDDERSREIESYLLLPAAASRLPLDVHGVRYPPVALATLERAGARFRGWLPNAAVPATFARYMATVHVPRQLYVTHLPGIPTIRVFEALACGIPLLSAPWDDSEGLFRPGRDFLMAREPVEMTRLMRTIAADEDLRLSLARHGRETIESRHTCEHRARELLDIVAVVRGTERERAFA
jgi:spore maturation protein CgeB